MRVSLSTVKFTGDYNKGKAEFEKLSKTKQAGLMGVEAARQNYNKTHCPSLKSNDSNLGTFVRHRVSIQDSIKKVLENFKIKK